MRGNLSGKLEVTHAGWEFIHCLEGKITCHIANQDTILSPGDSLLFDAKAPHHWMNSFPTTSRLLVLFCPMEARNQPAECHLDHASRHEAHIPGYNIHTPSLTACQHCSWRSRRSRTA